jgi:hypothetical protein
MIYVDTIGSIDDLIEKNELFLEKFQLLLLKRFQLFSMNINKTLPLSKLITRTGSILKCNEWKESMVLDLSTMPNGKIFINDFSNGSIFATNIKSINNLDLVYGSIRPYFKKAGFALDVDYVAGTIYSFNAINPKNYLWILACIASEAFHSFTTINSQGTKMPIINWNIFNSFKCPYEESIIDEFNDLIKPLFDLAIYKMKENRKLKMLKNQYLKKFFG